MSLIYKVFAKSCPTLARRGFHSSSSLQTDHYAKIRFAMAGYNKYGLLHDDLLKEHLWWVAEAVRRLPEEERLQRTYRAIRAQQADMNHTILPKEQWTKLEDNHYYLRPYIEEIFKEKEEMDEWEANH